MANTLPRDKQIAIVHHLVEGNTLRSTSRLLGVHRNSITRLLVKFGNGCKALLDDKLRHLKLRHVELDEIWTYVGKKQGRLTVDEKVERYDIGDIYLWTAIDQDTKLLPSHVVGKRSADNARKLLGDLAKRIDFPNPHTSDRHAYGRPGYVPIIQLSSDAFPGYREAVDLHFGAYCRYGQIIKQYRNASMVYTPSEMIATERRPIRDVHPREICTSHVERNNLTIRTLLKRFTRLSLGFSKKLENLEAAVAMFVAYYNFVWRCRYPDHSGRRGQHRLPAAFSAGVVNKLWNFETLFDHVRCYW